jgi:hypothetical protein
MKLVFTFLACAAAVLIGSFNGCSAEAAEPVRAREALAVTAEMVCSVQHAIRWREAAWTPMMCAKVAGALNETPAPVKFLAMAVNESDLRERAINVSRPGVYDIGLMAVRCVTLGAVAEETGSSSANPRSTTTTTIPRDRCTNGAARGLYAHRLLEPMTNIRTAAAVLASHRGSLRRYNGGTREHGYGARIAAIMSALGGVEVRVKGARMRKLVKQIVDAVEGAKRS